MKIVILGASLASGNRGVNALTRGTINSIFSKQKNASIIILSYSVKEEILHSVSGKEIKEVPFSPKKRLIEALCILTRLKNINNYSNVKEINYILEADYVLDISEGDSFSDIYGIKRFILHSIGKFLSIKAGKKLIIMPQTIGPFKNKYINYCAERLLSKANYIFTRDLISYEVVNKMNIDNKNVKCLPDMAFYMPPRENKLYENYFEQDKSIYGINVSALLFNGGYNKKNMFNFKSEYSELIESLIERILKNTDNKILLVPHVITDMEVEDDLKVCKEIAEKYKNVFPERILSIQQPLAEDELKYIISKCDLFIGGRMHACIAAISTNVVTMPIAYSRKFIGIWDGLGLESCVADPRNSSIEEIMAIYDYCVTNKHLIEDILREKNNEYKKYIGTILDIIQ